MAEELCRSYQEATNRLNEASPAALLVVCQHFKLPGHDSTEGVKTEKMALLRTVTRFLNGDDIEKQPDQGAAIFQEICTLLRNQGQNPAEGPAKPVLTTDQVSPHLVQVSRRDLKISGQIGEPGQKDRLSFSSLIHQIEGALKKGHTDGEVVESVIRAVVPGSPLRSYLEGRHDLTLPVLRRMLRAHFQEKGATELYHRLSSLAQENKESGQSFLVRALDLRQKVIFASKEAGSGLRYDENLVQNMFLHALHTGLQSEAIRNELRPLLENTSATDEELFEKMNQAAGRENERQEKLGSSSTKKVAVNAVSSAPEDPTPVKPKPREGTLMTEIAELRAGMAEVALIRKQLSDIQDAMRPQLHDQPMTRGRRRGCFNCEKEGTADMCDHCFKCGSSEHFARGCRRRYQDHASGNGRRLLPRDDQ